MNFIRFAFVLLIALSQLGLGVIGGGSGGGITSEVDTLPIVVGRGRVVTDADSLENAVRFGNLTYQINGYVGNDNIAYLKICTTAQDVCDHFNVSLEDNDWIWYNSEKVECGRFNKLTMAFTPAANGSCAMNLPRMGTAFPANPSINDPFIFIDESGAFLYYWDGNAWVKSVSAASGDGQFTDEGTVLTPSDATDDWIRVSGDATAPKVGSTDGTSFEVDIDNDNIADMICTKTAGVTTCQGASDQDTALQCHPNQSIQLKADDGAVFAEFACDAAGGITHSYGANYEPQGSVWIPAEASWGASGGADATATCAEVGGRHTCYRNVADATGELQYTIKMDPRAASPDFTLVVVWSDAADSGTDVCAVNVDAACTASGAALADTWSTADDLDTTITTLNALVSSSVLAEHTPAGSCTTSERFLTIRLTTDATAGNGACRFHGAEVFYRIGSLNLNNP